MNDDTMAGAETTHQADFSNHRPGAELMAPLQDAAASAAGAVKDNIAATLVGGLAVGLVVGALLPLARRRKRSKTMRGLATAMTAAVSELSQALATQAVDRAQTAADDGRDKLDRASQAIGKALHEHSEDIGKQAGKLADDATDRLNDGSKILIRKVVRFIEKTRG